MECAPFVADCHVRAGADLIAHTWDPVVLSALRAGPARRWELLAGIRGVSDKVLHESLARLVDRALVEREPDGTATYRLTELGESFANGPLLGLARWCEQHAAALAG